MITHVEIEQGESGCCLFSCTGPGRVVWDTWHETLEEALEVAQETWGVTRAAWTMVQTT